MAPAAMPPAAAGRVNQSCSPQPCVFTGFSLALQYLKGRRSWRAAPYLGGAPYRNEAGAVAELKRWTGQDFGRDAKAWGKWLRKNRSVCYRDPPIGPRIRISKQARLRMQREYDEALKMLSMRPSQKPPLRRSAGR